jgi:2-haloacid dehalogenase
METVDLRALAFDVFGTVVDWRSSIIEEVGAAAGRHGLTVDAAAFADAWRRRYQPSMDRVRQGAIGWTALDALNRASLDDLLRKFSLEVLDESEREDLNRARHRLRPWPDAVAGLTRLRPRHVLCTLSNGNVALLVDLARSRALPFDCILSAELCRAYKPDPRTYRMVPELLALRPDQVLMVAAHPDDLRAAAREGLRTAFVHRPLEWGAAAATPPEPAGAFDLAAVDFEDLAAQLGC